MDPSTTAPADRPGPAGSSTPAAGDSSGTRLAHLVTATALPFALGLWRTSRRDVA